MAVQLQDLLWGTLAELRYQPVPRRIRALLNGQLVLETMGLRVIRTTWREATSHPAVVQRRVADALSSTAST